MGAVERPLALRVVGCRVFVPELQKRRQSLGRVATAPLPCPLFVPGAQPLEAVLRHPTPEVALLWQGREQGEQKVYLLRPRALRLPPRRQKAGQYTGTERVRGFLLWLPHLLCAAMLLFALPPSQTLLVAVTIAPGARLFDERHQH